MAHDPPARPLPPARILPPPHSPRGSSGSRYDSPRPTAHGASPSQTWGGDSVSAGESPPQGPPPSGHATPDGPPRQFPYGRPPSGPHGSQRQPPYGAPGPYDYERQSPLPSTYTPADYGARRAYAEYAARHGPYGHHPQGPWGQAPVGYGGYGGYAGYGWGAPPPRRRRRNPVTAIVLGTVGSLASLVFVLVLVNAFLHSTGSALTDSTLDHRPAAPKNPKATPVPASDPFAVVKRNTLYEQGGLHNGSCPARDLGDASKAEQTRFYEALLNCLNREWRPAVESAGFDYYEPGLVVFDSPVTTPCGNASPLDGRTLAFYCPSDNVLYADVIQMRKSFADIDVAYAIVIGHEFGHHVQQETGILNAYRLLAHGNAADALELNRRVELQASCMGGLFLGAIAESFPMNAQRLNRLQQVAGSFGDEPGGPEEARDHGSGRSNRAWIGKGYADNDIGTCNTFRAPASEVE